MRNALVIDPGEKTGVALCIDDVVSCTYRIMHPKINQLFATMKTYGSDLGISTLVIEDQFYGRNIKTMLDTHGKRTEWSTVAKMLFWDVVVVHPSTWQAYWGITARGTHTKGEEHKELMRKFAEKVSGMKFVKDECDAWLMAGWWLSKGLGKGAAR